MLFPLGMSLSAITISVEDLISPTGLMLLGLGGLVLILWILGMLLIRGATKKAMRGEIAVFRGTLDESKDLIDGLHESVGRSSDGIQFFREKVDNRLGTLSRSVESLPRINEGVAGLRESITSLESAIASGTASLGGGVDPAQGAELEKTRGELAASETRIEELEQEISGFHETLQASALAEDQGSDEGVFKVKLAEVEEARKKLDAEKESFERNQSVIKGQIKEAGEKLKQAKEEVRRERENLEKARSGAPGAEDLTEEKVKLQKEWEALEQQQSMLKGEQEWVDTERKTLEEEREEIEKIREDMDREGKSAAPSPSAGGLSSGELALPETEVIEEPQASDGERLPGSDTSSEDLRAWGYSSLAQKTEGKDIPTASEEDITSLAETASDEKNREEWEGMLEETRDEAPETSTGETYVDQEVTTEASFGDEDTEGLDSPVQEETMDLPGLSGPDDVEDIPPAPKEAPAASEQDLPIDETFGGELDEEVVEETAPEEDLPMDTSEPAAFEEDLAVEDPLDEPVEAAELDVWEEEEVPGQAPSIEDAAPVPSAAGGEQLTFTQRIPGIEVGAYAGIFAVRIGFDEMKNDQAHGLDEIIFSETSDKEDKILLDLTQLKYINSRGLSSVTKIAVQRTAHIVLTNDNVLKIMDMMGFLPLFTLFDTVEEALEAFGETEV